MKPPSPKFLFLAFAFAFAFSAAADIDWTKAMEIRPGIRYIRHELDEPRLMKAFLIRVDLQTPGIKFTGTGRDPKWGE